MNRPKFGLETVITATRVAFSEAKEGPPAGCCGGSLLYVKLLTFTSVIHNRGVLGRTTRANTRRPALRRTNKVKR